MKLDDSFFINDCLSCSEPQKGLSNTLEPEILQKNICFYTGKKTRVQGM